MKHVDKQKQKYNKHLQFIVLQCFYLLLNGLD